MTNPLIILNILLTIYLIIQNKQIMATTKEQFDAVMDRIDARTNGIADELRSLKDLINNQGMPAEIEMQVLNRLSIAADKLEGIGKTDTPDEGGLGEEDGTVTEETPTT